MIRGKLLAIGAAGALALGGAGLYAGSLTATADGTLGAGQVSAQASCASAIDVQPGYSSYRTDGLLPSGPNSNGHGYNDLDLTITEASDGACNNKQVMVTVFDQDNSDAVVAYSVQAPVVDTAGLTETLNLAIEGGDFVASGDDLSYAVVIQDNEL